MPRTALHTATEGPRRGPECAPRACSEGTVRQGGLGLARALSANGRCAIQSDSPSHITEAEREAGGEGSFAPRLLFAIYSSCFCWFCWCLPLYLILADSCVKNGLGEYFSVPGACLEKNRAEWQETGRSVERQGREGVLSIPQADVGQATGCSCHGRTPVPEGGLGQLQPEPQSVGCSTTCHCLTLWLCPAFLQPSEALRTVTAVCQVLPSPLRPPLAIDTIWQRPFPIRQKKINLQNER